MQPVRWGIIGPGRIATNFATGLAESSGGALVAIASRSPQRLAAFGMKFGVPIERRHASYASLCADPEVEAVYIATPQPFHAEQALMAVAAGKHLLLEKPAGVSAAEVERVVAAAAARGVFFMEAYMYLHHPQIARSLAILAEGRLGAVTHVRAAFGFDAPFDPESRLYAAALAGGGILDVGGYPVSAACLFAGAAAGDFADPVAMRGIGLVGRTGVDEAACAALRFGNGVTAEVSCAVARALGEFVEVRCENGMLRLENPWVPGRDAGPSDADILVTVAGETHTERIAAPEMLYAFEAAAASRAIRAGHTSCPFPAMTPAASIANARALDAWRREVFAA